MNILGRILVPWQRVCQRRRARASLARVKYVLFYEAAADFRTKVPLHFEAHRARWGEFQAAGTLLMIGPFTDEPAGGALAVFKTRSAAEEFAAKDPFVIHGLVARWTIREWNEVLMP